MTLSYQVNLRRFLGKFWFDVAQTCASRSVLGASCEDECADSDQVPANGGRAIVERAVRPRRVSTTLRHMVTEFSEFFHLSRTAC